MTSGVDPLEPLKYPADFPPRKGTRQHFFIGVRGLGPDLSFFKRLSAISASRTEAILEKWQDPKDRELARCLGALCCKHLRWPTGYFIPGDRVAVIFNGPAFSLVDHFDWDGVISEFHSKTGIAVPDEFWRGVADLSFGDFVTRLNQSRSI